MRAAAVLAVGLVLVMSTLVPAKRPIVYAEGPITDIGPGQAITVAGYTFQVTSETVILMRICSGGGGGGAGEVVPIQFDDLEEGQIVKVSGLYEGGVLVAKRIMVKKEGAVPS